MKLLTTIGICLFSLVPGSPLCGSAAGEEPVGLILSSHDAGVIPAGSELPLTARVGEILYAGDSVRSETGPVTILFCPEKSSVRLDAGSDVLIGSQGIRVRSGRIAEKTSVEFCRLPPIERTLTTGQQHYGGSMTRGLDATGGEERFPSGIDELLEDRRNSVRRELRPLDEALAKDPRDLAAHMARADLFERYNLHADALEEYRRIASGWPEAVWVRSRIFVHEKELGRTEPRVSTLREGKTYALLVGVSRYQRLSEAQWLRYAHQDAVIFDKYLRSPRGGALADSDIVLLTDEKATTAAIRNAFETLLTARAGRDDTVIVFIAAHGIVETGPRRAGYIITYDSDPEDLASTALPMADLQNLIREDLSRVGHLLVYVDVCRAGNIGALRGTNTINRAVEELAESEGDLFLFLASGPREYSYEGPQYGGGHGAFSYFLLDALNGQADFDRDASVNIGEVIEYVREKVVEATVSRQHPRDLGSMGRNMALAEMRDEGITLGRFAPAPASRPVLTALAETSGARGLEKSAPGGTSVSSLTPLKELDLAIAEGRVLPDAPNGAFGVLRRLRREVTPEEYLVQQNKLRIALEDQGQQVLLRYLSGDQTPQTRGDFVRGAAYFEAARLLTPESLFLEGRATFCSGRAALFENEYPRARDLLETAVRIDPAGAYSYNALGIAYLEEANYNRAILAFRDAIRLAPYWAYPLHNLALAQTQRGEYEAAIASYRKAMRLAPHYSYLPYNLGLVYQRLNRRREAEGAYRRAIALTPERGEPYNGLGYLYASVGRIREAESLYRQALERDPGLLAARHNLAVLLADLPNRLAEAYSLWRQNLSVAADYLPSRLGLAKTLARQGEHPQAVQEYTLVVRQKPEYVAARLALAELYRKEGDPEASLRELREASRLQPGNPLVHEEVGDGELSLGRRAEAHTAYELALKYSHDKGAQRRIRSKLRTVSQTRAK